MRRVLALSVLILITACSPSGESTEMPLSTTATITPATTANTRAAASTPNVAPPFGISSPAFDDGGVIPIEYTCDGDDVSPELSIVGLPEGTQSIVVIVDDPDAPLGAWDHWVEFDIVTGPGSYRIQRAATKLGVPGVNGWNLEGYKGLCPPDDERHRYFFRVYAVTATLDLPAGVDSTRC